MNNFNDLSKAQDDVSQSAGVISLQIDSNQISVDEGDGAINLTVVRTLGSTGVVSVDYRSFEGSAKENSDYTPVSGTVTFNDGETSKVITIPVLEDTVAEGAETLSITIDNIVGGAELLAPRTASVTIEDNDILPGASIYNGNQYLLTSSGFTWEQAQAEAKRLGGNLVTINDGLEEVWLQEKFGSTEEFWIGINDLKTKGQFEWASGQPLTYTNWAPLQPDGGRVTVMNFESALQWDDKVPDAFYRGIIEIGSSNPSSSEGDNTGNADLISETIVSGLTLPTAIDWTPEGATMFIAEKGGVIKVVQNGVLRETPFIDLSAQVNEQRDRGLLDIAVHPDFFNGQPYLYALYSYDPPEVQQNTGLAGPDGSGNRAGRLTRITVDPATMTAVPNSEVVILGRNSTWNNFNGFVNSTIDFDEPPAKGIVDKVPDFVALDSESHSPGTVDFGPDGALYVSTGDGTSFNQIDSRAVRVQYLDNLSGKILRLDPITGAGLADNPFYNGDPNSDTSKIYQYGFRNPFRFSIDSQTGKLYIGDVGWSTWEEINGGGAGANFGWPYYEGGNGTSLRTVEYSDLPEAQAFYASGQTVIAPLLALNHATDNANAILAGDVYRGDSFPEEYQGDLFFNDLAQGIVRNISFDDSGKVASVDTFATDTNTVVQILQGPDDNLYYVELYNGAVGRWSFENTDSPVIDPSLDTAIYRFQNSDVPGTYIYVGEEERQSILSNFKNFQEEGLAFNVGVTPGEDLIPIYRFQSLALPGTYLFVGEEERTSINNSQFAQTYREEGLAFYVYGVGSDVGTTFYRFQNSDVPGTYLYAGPEERQNILNLFPNFQEEGAAFSVGII